MRFMYFSNDYVVEGENEAGSWWGLKRGNQSMSQAKLLAFYVTAATVPELITQVEAGLAEVRKAGGAQAPASGGKAPAAPKETPAAAAPKATLEEIKNKLTELKTIIDTREGEDKKLGLKAIKALLKEFKVTQSPDLKPEQFDPFLAAVEAAIAKQPKEDDGGESY